MTNYLTINYLQMKKIFNYGKGRIQYYDQGNGKVIILIHGYLETSDIWSSFAKKLSRQFRVISLDLPGHGGSDIFDSIHTMEFMATVVKDLCESLDIRKAFITGHSLGGYVTLAFVDLFPGMLYGYCLFHSHPFADSPEVIEKRKLEIGLLKEGKKDKFIPDSILKMYATPNLGKFRDALKRSKKISDSIPVEGIIAVLKGMMARPSRQAVMEKGQVPLLWILGTMDNYINCEQIQTKVNLPANAEVFILKNSGHMGFIEEEGLALEKLTEFVEELS